MKRKLFCNQGETLVETLAAILMVSLSSVLFLTLVNAGVRISSAGDGQIQELDQQLSVAEQANTAGRDTETIKIEQGSNSVEIPVTYFGEDGQLRSYRQRDGAP